MTIAVIGEMTIGEAMPGAAAGVSAGIAGISAALPDIAARLAALAAFAPQPINFATQLALAQQIVASIQASIAAVPPLPIPDIGAQIAQVAALVASLKATVSGIQGQLDLLVVLQGAFAAAGIHVFAFDGPIGNFGAEFAIQLAAGLPGGGGPGAHANALVFATADAVSWQALSQIVRVSP